MIPCKGPIQLVLLAFLVTSSVLLCCAHKQRTCPTQHLVIRDGYRFHNIEWKSKSDSDYAVVLSKPPCFDKNGKLVVKICANGTWLSPKDSTCYSVEKSSLCPPNFDERDKSCIYVTEPQTWERHCPYPGAGSILKENNGAVWLPFKRTLSYGSFEYVLPGENYGLDYSDIYSSESFEDVTDSTKMDCVIKRFNNVEFTSCDSMYPHVCSYAYDSALYDCPKGCVPGGLGSRYCYCKTQYLRFEAPIVTNMFCGALATPRYSYERDILFQLAGSDTCLVGNVQENSSFTSMHVEDTLYLAIHKNEWGLHTFYNINCAICIVEPLLFEKVDLQLKFNTMSHKIYLNVYSPHCLFKIDKEEAIFCFTDATGELKTRVEVEEVSHFHLGRPSKVYKVAIVNNEPGNYWCEAFQMPNVTLIKSNTVVAYKKLKGHEYSLRVKIFNFCRFSLLQCKFPSVRLINFIIKILFHDRFFSRFIKKVRLFHIYNIDSQNETLDLLLHLTSETRLPLQAEYSVIRRNLRRLRSTSIIFFRSSLVCLAETTYAGNLSLRWQLSTIGKMNVPKEICLRENGSPVRRKCEGTFTYGSQWGKVDGNCTADVELSSKTQILHSFLSLSSSMVSSKNISAITENSTDLTVLDVHYLAEALTKISKLDENSTQEFISELTQIIDNLMMANSTTLKQSQILLNSTDEILDIFENKLYSVNMSNDKFLFRKNNLVVHVSKPFLNNISGIALYGEEDTPFSKLKIIYLYSNTTLRHLAADDDLEVATYVPEKLLNTISENISLEAQSGVLAITTIYCKDNFFNTEMNENDTVASRIVSVSLPGYEELIRSPIPVLFRSTDSSRTRKKHDCAFWNYGTASESNIGYWSTLGGNYIAQYYNTSLQICSFSHLTNFAFLIRDEDYVKEGNNASQLLKPSLEEHHHQILTVISDIGCSLSIMGIFGIFFTGLIFQTWRNKVGTKILIQLCIAILLQIIFVNVAAVRDPQSPPSKGICKIVGICLHYVTISEFSWMLVAAVLQFFRFVKVLGPMPNRIILKAMMVGWGVPIFPVILMCLVNSQSYLAGIQGICYLKGLSMYIGVLLPIAVIVCANMAVFVAVIRNVFVLSIESRGNSHAILKRQICLAVLLFFLLGLPWMFGLLSELLHNAAWLSYLFLYLFCITATLQGFVLFIFYVILDKGTRMLWFLLFKKYFPNKRC